MPRTEKQRLRRKAKARAQRLHPQPAPQLARMSNAISQYTAAVIRP